MEGLSPPRVPRLRLGGGRPGHRGRRHVREAGRQAREPPLGPRGAPARRVAHRHRAHPLGHARRAHRRQRPPAPRRRRRPAGADPQRHHRELPRAEEGARRRGRRSSSPRPTPRSPPSSSAREYDRVGDLTEAMLNVVQRLEGAFTLLAVHADSPGVVVGARRNSPLVVGLGDGENFLGSDVAAFIGHTRHALELGQDQIVTITPDGYAVINFDGTPARRQGLRGHLGRRRRREGRLRHLHGEGDPRPAARGRRHPPRPHRRRPAGSCSTRCGSARSSCARSSGSRSSPAAPRPTPAWSRSTRSSTGPASRSRSASPTSSATATRSSTARTLVVVDQPVRRDDGHPDGGQARVRARAR